MHEKFALEIRQAVLNLSVKQVTRFNTAQLRTLPETPCP